MYELPVKNYSTRTYNRQSVEAIEPGAFEISFENVSDDWREEDTVQRLRNEIEDTLEALKDAIPGCRLLRLVAVNSNLYDEYHKWRHEIGWEYIVPPAPTNEYWGKAFTWGDGNPETTWAVLVMPDFTADSVMYTQGPSRYGNCRLAHDLAHIHSEALYLQSFEQLQPIRTNNWLRLCHYYAYLCWSEYLAEVTSCRYSSQGYWYSSGDLRGSLWPTMDRTELISRLLEDHRKHGDVYWAGVLSVLDSVFSSLGRVLGNLQGGEELGNRLMDVFINQLIQGDPVWGESARQLQKACRQLLDKDWMPELLNTLERIVLDALVRCGIQEADGLL